MEAMEVWLWRQTERIKRSDKVKNKDALQLVEKDTAMTNLNSMSCHMKACSENIFRENYCEKNSKMMLQDAGVANIQR